MRFGQFLRLDRGSNTVGFALVAPLLVACFLAVTQIANVANVKTVVTAATKAGAREASRFDATLDDGINEANRILSNHGISEIDQVEVKRIHISGVNFVEVTVTKNYLIPWLDLTIPLHSIGRSVDEKFL